MVPLAVSVIWWIFALCLLMGLAAWLVFAWSIRTGQFDDPDAVAEAMLEQDRQVWYTPKAEDGESSQSK